MTQIEGSGFGAAAARFYRCADCGLHYSDRETAEACHRHCTVHRACSLEITRHSVERRAAPRPAPRDHPSTSSH